jgi:hypothetical protein
MKFTHIPAIAILGALVLGAPSTASAQTETERVDRTVQIRAGGQVRLRNFSGKVTITGSNRGDMVVHAVRQATRDRLDHIKLDITETGSGVSIEANRKDDSWRDRDNNVVDTDLEIQVPTDVTLDVDVFSSDVVVKDVRGRQRVHTFSGKIDVSGAEAALDAETFSGSIAVGLAQGVGANVDFDSFSGSLNSDVPMVFRSSDRHHTRADIGAGGTDYHFKTFSGSLRIK